MFSGSNEDKKSWISFPGKFKVREPMSSDSGQILSIPIFLSHEPYDLNN